MASDGFRPTEPSFIQVLLGTGGNKDWRDKAWLISTHEQHTVLNNSFLTLVLNFDDINTQEDLGEKTAGELIVYPLAI
jgi:hypothetical protein